MVLLALSFLVAAETHEESAPNSRARRLDLLHWPLGLVIGLLPALVLISGMTSGLARGVSQLTENNLFVADLPRLFAGSVVIGIGTGLLMTAALLFLAYVRPSGWTRKIWRGLTAPSTTFAGFALLIVWRSFGLASYGKITLGLGLLWLPTMFRYQWESRLAALEKQVAVARVLGVRDEGLIFCRIVGPQCLGPALRLGGLAAFWAWGDFALSRVVAERTLTVAMAAQELMVSYRFDGATILVWAAVSGGLLNFVLFLGAAHVFGEKSPT